ncbi:MAG: SRPBCC family protein [Halovenus sp.]
MRTVEVSQEFETKPSVVGRALDPSSVIEYEGSFSVLDVDDRGEDYLIVAGGSGLQLTLRFEEHEQGVFYELEDAEGQPLETMETTITYRATDGGTTVTAVSEVSMGLPPAAITDRLAAWKRKGELQRALDALADEIE